MDTGSWDSEYQEIRPAPDLVGLVQSVWYRRIGSTESGHEVRIVPDGCMDLLWSQNELRVAGPDTTAWLNRMVAGTEIFGLRFLPAVAAPLLRWPASEVINARPRAADLSRSWAARVTDRLEADPVGTHTVLQDAVRSLLRDGAAPDPLVRHLCRVIDGANPDDDLRVASLADEVGISERQLHRRCLVGLGYGIKTYSRIVRLQHYLALQQSDSPATLADRAAQAGYADQAHLARDVRLLTSLSPSALLAGSA